MKPLLAMTEIHNRQIKQSKELVVHENYTYNGVLEIEIILTFLINLDFFKLI